MSSKTTQRDKSDAQEPAQERPDDCECWDAELDLPCFECYKEGFETQNPETPGADEDSNDSNDNDVTETEQATLAEGL